MTDQELIAPDLPEQRDPKKAQLKPGWYKVADSNDIGSMEAIQVDDFPTQIVVWRGKDDQLSALDLYCRHMGASLACGEVEEDGIRCPFHAWRWSGEGPCNEVPYAKRIPQKLLLVHGKWMNLTAQFMFGLIEMVILQILMEKE